LTGTPVATPAQVSEPGTSERITSSPDFIQLPRKKTGLMHWEESLAQLAGCR